MKTERNKEFKSLVPVSVNKFLRERTSILRERVEASLRHTEGRFV